MSENNTNNSPEIPEWVLRRFDDVSQVSPTKVSSPVSKDDQMLSTASRQVQEDRQLISLFADSPSKLKKVCQRMFENLVILGLLNEAGDFVNDFADSFADPDSCLKIVSDYKQALTVPDEEFCSCSDDFAGKVPISRFRVVQRIFSYEKGQMVDIKKCVKCSFMNATLVKTNTENLISQKVANAKEGESDEKVFK